MPRYTFVTTYIIEAPDEAKARETVSNVESQVRHDTQVVEHWTRLTDIEEPYDVCPGGDACPHEEVAQ